MTSGDIELALATCHVWKPRTHAIVPRVSWGLLNYEADLLVCSDKARVCQEVEIKISWQDFLAEFRAEPHSPKDRKHKGFAGEYQPYRGQKISFYWFAAPLALAERIADYPGLPSYAGVLAIPENPNKYAINGRPVQVLKKAKRIAHARKLTDAEYLQLNRLGMIKLWAYRTKDNASP